MSIEDTIRARGVIATVPRQRVTHIPLGPGNTRTYCGKDATKVACIDLVRDCIDDATCKTCGRSDDRRTADEYRKTDEYKKTRELERELLSDAQISVRARIPKEVVFARRIARAR